ncbi:hypothetical protein ASF43_28975 [Pseudorhodoferax sp. Leaf267]|nr:hypothetical protein ASF43_28975 [Pseudorhodoferax sp. Leaf267]
MNGPSFGADSQPAAGGAAASTGTVPRATREETRVLQEQAAAVTAPEPSIRVELSAQADALIRSGRVEAEAQAGAAAGAVFVAASAAGPRPGAVGEPSTAGGVQGLRAMEEETAKASAAQKPESPEAMAKYLSTGQKPGPDEPTGTKEATSKDWTEKPKVEEEKPPEPPKEPISKKLLEFLQSLWRAGGNAIDVAQNGNLVLNPPKESDGPVTYADPSAKKTTGI